MLPAVFFPEPRALASRNHEVGQDSTGRVFRVRADGRIDCLLDNVPSPNGLVLDLSESVLYLAVYVIQLSGGGAPDGA